MPAELGGSIDPHPFVDRDGTPYLLWKADGNASGRQPPVLPAPAARRSRPRGRCRPLLPNDAAWENPLIENPALVRVAGYLLLYSGGWWESESYATGYATCTPRSAPASRRRPRTAARQRRRAWPGPVAHA